jgi:hypothetical protein
VTLNAGRNCEEKWIAVPFVVGNAKNVEVHYSCHPSNHGVDSKWLDAMPIYFPVRFLLFTEEAKD